MLLMKRLSPTDAPSENNQEASSLNDSLDSETVTEPPCIAIRRLESDDLDEDNTDYTSSKQKQRRKSFAKWQTEAYDNFSTPANDQSIDLDPGQKSTL